MLSDLTKKTFLWWICVIAGTLQRNTVLLEFRMWLQLHASVFYDGTVSVSHTFCFSPFLEESTETRNVKPVCGVSHFCTSFWTERFFFADQKLLYWMNPWGGISSVRDAAIAERKKPNLFLIIQSSCGSKPPVDSGWRCSTLTIIVLYFGTKRHRTPEHL